MKEDLLKTPKMMYDFIYNFVIFFQWIYMLGMGEKPWNIYKRNQGKIYEKLSPPSELSSENMFRLDESIFGVWLDMSP